MSRVYFHTPSDSAELLGREREHARAIAYDIACGMLNDAGGELEGLIRLTAHGDLAGMVPIEGGRAFLDRLRLYFRTSREGDRLLTWAGRDIRASSLAYNTAILLGNDQVRFLVRMSAQCEIHAYVEGHNRAWLADIIETGLACGLYRQGMGWDARPDHPHGKGQGVIPLLRSRDDEPVVMSSSFCDVFPNPDVAGLDEDEWDALADAEQWQRAMDGLRRQSETDLLELKPDDFAGFRFGHELTLLDLYADDWRERVERALGLEPSAVPGEPGHG